MPLTDSAIRNAKSSEKQRKMADEKGLYLLISPKGGKWWRLDYRFGGKRKTLSMGTYPDVGLKQARDRRDVARKQISNGIDPSEVRKAENISKAGAESFEAITREWYAKFSPSWAASHASKIIRRFEKDLFPYLGKRAIGEINAPELLAVLRRVEDRGAIETAHRAKQNCGQVFRYAVATGRAERDPTGDLKGAIPPPKKSRHAAITDPKKVGELLRAIDAYSGSSIVRAALQLSALTFVRPGELRQAEWVEFDLSGAQWVIPAERMKMKAAHIVPLSRQAINVLEELQPLTGSGKYVFPGARSAKRPLSDNGPRTALRVMGYANNKMTPHGFRAMASTLLNEQGWRADVIERQLAHAEQNRVRAAYHRAEYLEERRKMMQAWADYLDSLASGAKVVLIRKRSNK
ncbi:MAG: integrase arm-type DNA-binding domain-containing protein [Gammaproteobacteria bacterium]|nr:integrase arm-type DNA-binding domain-containing protein [Gammaproteobacteria bacterium]